MASAHELVVTHREGAAVFHAVPDAGLATALDVLVETVCDLLEVDYAGVHLLDGDLHHVLASSDDVAHPAVLRSDSLCGVLLSDHLRAHEPGVAAPAHLVEVSDTAAQPGLPFATGTDGLAPVRFYAGTPLFDRHERPLGTLCVIAHHPRILTGVERRALLVMGIAASQLLAGCGEPLGG